MHSLLPDYPAKLRFDAQPLATLRGLGEYQGKQQLCVSQSPEVLSDLRQVAVVDTEPSSRLEGVVVAAHRLKSLVLKYATPIERGLGARGCRVRVEILKRNLPFLILNIGDGCPSVSRDMVRVVLRAMNAEGLIVPTGKGRAAKW
jgi:hypothetical protein